MSDKLRWYCVGLAILVGAGLVLFGALTGEQWATFVGALFSGGGALAAPGPKQ